jgi:hypothetical protein
MVIRFRCRLFWYKGGHDAGRDFYDTARSCCPGVKRYRASKPHFVRVTPTPNSGSKKAGTVLQRTGARSWVASH